MVSKNRLNERSWFSNMLPTFNIFSVSGFLLCRCCCYCTLDIPLNTIGYIAFHRKLSQRSLQGVHAAMMGMWSLIYTRHIRVNAIKVCSHLSGRIRIAGDNDEPSPPMYCSPSAVMCPLWSIIALSFAGPDKLGVRS